MDPPEWRKKSKEEGTTVPVRERCVNNPSRQTSPLALKQTAEVLFQQKQEVACLQRSYSIHNKRGKKGRRNFEGSLRFIPHPFSPSHPLSPLNLLILSAAAAIFSRMIVIVPRGCFDRSAAAVGTRN